MASSAGADKQQLYHKLVATIPAIELKGASVLFTSHNGHMFSYLSKSGTLALRLPPAALADFLKKYKTVLCRQYGVVQTEYAEVPDALLQKTSELGKYLAVSFEYVRGLKTKGAAKKKR